MHLNINSLLTHIDELRETVKALNVTADEITTSKLDNSITDSEISIRAYSIIRRDRNSRGGSVVCYGSNKICYNVKNCVSNRIGNIFIEFLIPKTKPITLRVI